MKWMSSFGKWTRHKWLLITIKPNAMTTPQQHTPEGKQAADVSSRFSVIKTTLSDFALFAIVDNDLNKVVCHLVYDNGEEYCQEMADKILAGLNGR
jgi:hypothetical protein